MGRNGYHALRRGPVEAGAVNGASPQSTFVPAGTRPSPAGQIADAGGRAVRYIPLVMIWAVFMAQLVRFWSRRSW